MNVIVVGALRELQHLLLELSRRGHHVVVVDNNVERIKALEERLDIPCYNVDLLDYEALTSIGFHRADVLIAAHPEDSINLVVSVYAKTEGIPRIYAVVSEEAIARALVGL
ncbi:MAG: NAD-binding protein, partial [Acidilobaceae archaeon]